MEITITNEIWDFIEENLPGYHHRDDVLRHSDLQLLVDGHESSITGLPVEEAVVELEKLTLRFCLEAIQSYMKQPGGSL